ncbi:MAG: NnrS family protein [Candidatus Binatia bacterium]
MILPEAAAAGATENEAMKAAPYWRREPYAVFFPLGIVLSWAGVGRWLDFALAGRHEDYLAVWIFHGMAQVQGFLLCFAMGFLFTMIPRRTGTAPPSTLEMIVALTAPVFTVVAAWTQHWALSQAGWIVSAVLLVTFILRRFASRSARRRPPPGFVWIPVSLLLGLVGSLLTGARGSLGNDWLWLHDLGQHFVLQGVFLGLVLGVGGLVLPLMTRGTAPADTAFTGRDIAAVLGHLAAAAALVASFFVQTLWSVSAGCGLRAAVLTVVLLLGPELWRLPVGEGWNRRVIWVAAWMLPVGYAFAALRPQYYQAGLHIAFVSGLAMLTLAVSTHVILGHSGQGQLLREKPWQVGAIALLMVAATAARVAMTLDPLHRNSWMATAAFFFLCATGVWCLFLLPPLFARRE